MVSDELFYKTQKFYMMYFEKSQSLYRLIREFGDKDLIKQAGKVLDSQIGTPLIVFSNGEPTYGLVVSETDREYTVKWDDGVETTHDSPLSHQTPHRKGI